MSSLLIAGAGGHGRVVADAAQASGAWDRIAFLDDRFPGLEKSGVWPVKGSLEDAASFFDRYTSIVVALGDNAARLHWIDEYREQGFELPVIVHPTAVISSHSHIGEGSVVLARAVINIGARLDVGCIVNTGAVVEHDCRLADGVHISPGASLAGNVSVGRCGWIGIGVSVRQCLSIGDEVIVGAGAAVVADLPSGVTAFGVPARVIKGSTEKQ